MKWANIRSYEPLRMVHLLVVVTLWLLFLWNNLSSHWLYFPLFLAGMPIVYEGVTQLIHKKISSEFFLIIATVIALLGGEQSAILIVLIIMLIAQYIDTLVKLRTEDALKSLMHLIPEVVLLKKGTEELLVPLEEVQPGMQLIIKTGARIPVDGRIVLGSATIQEAVLTGESMPLEKGQGELVFAGTFVEEGSLVIEVLMIGKETLFGKITILLDQAGQNKAHIVRLADRITALFTPLFLLFIGVVWLVTHNATMVITLLIFGSPLELTLVTPLTMLAAIVAAFRRGILVKGGDALESLAATTMMIFDKTGTLTMGAPEVVLIKSLHKDYSEHDILFLAAIAEKKSGHVIAQAILQKAAQLDLEIPDPEAYVSLTGHGITITYKGLTYRIGNRHFIEAAEHGNQPLPAGCDIQESFTSFFVATPENVVGQICLADRIKPEARQTIHALKDRGIRELILLSGDKQGVAQAVASELGITRAFGEVRPDEKLAMLAQFQEQGYKVTMIGDGINDAPALKQAQVGIALGGMGMEPAIQAADIVLMSGRLDQIVFLYDIAQAAMRTIRRNIILGFGVTHMVGIMLALASLITPIQAALFHAVPDLLILLTGVRLIRFGETRS